MTTSTIIDFDRALRDLTIKGMIIIALFAALVGLWAARLPIAGAVVATGQLVVTQNLRKVQHPTGGVVGELLARDGDHVQAGQVVVRLDETVIRSTLHGITKKIDELQARAARLNAERVGYASLVFPKALLDRQTEPEISEILTTEGALYEARKTSHMLRKQRLEERVLQLRKEMESLVIDLRAKQQLAEIAHKELAGLKSLDSQRLVTTQRLNALEREAVNLTGQQGQLAASIAQAEGKIVETQMQVAGLDDELRAETTKELREVQAELAQQQEKRAAAVDQLQRIDIRAPVSGQVHQSTVHTVGGVITAAEPIMMIVPTEEVLELDIRIQPHDIDLLYVGQSAVIRINAFNRRTTPDIAAVVTRVSADVSKDQQTGALFYTARLSLDQDSVASLDGLKLQAGMQAETLIKTNERTVLEYLSKPLVDQMRRALRER
jgi:HlyD family secretion protein